MPDWFDENAAAQLAARRAGRARAHQIAMTAVNWPARLAGSISETLQELRPRRLPIETWEYWYREDTPAARSRRIRRGSKPQPTGVNLYRRSVRSWPSPPGLAVWSDGAEVPLLITKDARLCWARQVISHPRDWTPPVPTAEPFDSCEDAPDGARCLIRDGEITLGGYGFTVGVIEDHVVVQVLRGDVGEDEPETTTLDLTMTLAAWAMVARNYTSSAAAEAEEELDGRLRCPTCGYPMHPYEEGGVSGEQCDACGGVFLDADELNRLTRVDAAH